MNLFLSISAAFLGSLLFTRWLLTSSNPLISIDAPNARSLHQSATPSGGGVSIVAALLAFEIIFRLQGGSCFPDLYSAFAFFSIATVSFLDDHFTLSSRARFAVHLLAAGLLFYGGLRWESLPLPGAMASPLEFGWLALPATLLFAVWFTNLFNFMDGMDGFSGGMAVFGFGGCSWMAFLGGDPLLGTLCAIVAASAAGFLAWNFPPASIFMGDVAAAPLGFLVAVVAFRGIAGGSFDLWVPLILFAPFWVDATSTLIHRAAKRKRFWEPHRSHGYQRLAQAGWGHRRTTLAEYGLMALMVIAARIYLELNPQGKLLLLALLALFFVALGMLVRFVEARAKI